MISEKFISDEIGDFVDKIERFLIKFNFEYVKNFDISTISTIKLGSTAKLVIFPKNIKEFERLLIIFNSLKVYYRVVGNVSNVLFVGVVEFPLIVTNKMTDDIILQGNIVTVSAGVSISKFSDFLRKNNLSGLEGLIGIPATIGGALMNNAGAYGYSISDRLVSVYVFENGQLKNLTKNQIKFGYHFSNLRNTIILSATFLFENKNEYDIINLCNEFTYLRNKNQPSGLSLGSVYSKVNGKSAGFFIERSGLKGKRVGGVVVSNKHSNFFINDNFGTAMDFLRLSALVEKTVESQFGVKLIPEIEKVGDYNEINCRLPYSF